MTPNEYGPFANIVALALALVAVFSLFLLKALGGVRRWTWLTSDSPPFLVTAGVRILAIALMAMAYIIIDQTNYRWFGGGAVLSGLLAFVFIARFDGLRKQYVVQIPLVDTNGAQQLNSKGEPLFSAVVIGTESEMLPDAKAALAKARKRSGGVSLVQFMSGYGAQKVNDPEAIWDRSLLAGRSNNLTVLLMCVVLFAVLGLYLAALIIDVAGAGTAAN